MKTLLFALVLPVLLAAQQCAPGGVYSQEREKCFFYHPEEVTFEEAHALCGGQELSIYDVIDKESFIGKQAFEKLGAAGKNVWLSGIPSADYQKLRLADDVSRAVRSDSHVGKIGHYVRNGECAKMQTADGSWLKTTCSTKSSVVCVSQPLKTSASCSSGYVYFDRVNQCYKFKIQDTNFQDAENDCKSEGGHLASIHSQMENDYIVSKTKTGNQGWSDDGLFIGLYYTNNQWKYTDGTSFDYKNWANGEPNNIGWENWNSIMPDPDSPDYNPKGGQWNNINENLRGYICKKHPLY